MRLICSKCKIEKEETEFHRNKEYKTRNGRVYQCKICFNAYTRARWPQYKIKSDLRVEKIKERFYKYINEFKQKNPCVGCGEKEIICLDFHHIDPNEKKYQISYMIRHNFTKILKEINKCVIVCANCHRKIHAGTLDINELIGPKRSIKRDG